VYVCGNTTTLRNPDPRRRVSTCYNIINTYN